ncbi:hypothetical protein OG758_03310 [Streptomyces sp. NBC_01474]|uniref:hypothetical protein n=1 Tax=unclassified Streptomyces TaxID=2593676 RepID=UPI002DD948DB|nr:MULTISPECIES: hypothetical protein [unclassified Streptomyces]WSD93303.1 hypothetical protein OG758_03310 [Streptomyces sp. NBC_01474]
MAMVGLFWIAEGDVYVGAKPSGVAPGVRLTPEGVVGLGDRQFGLHLWEDVTALTVTDIPVKSLMRRVGVVKDLALSAVTELALPVSSGRLDDAPPLMTGHGAAHGRADRLGAHSGSSCCGSGRPRGSDSYGTQSQSTGRPPRRRRRPGC